MNRTKIIFPYEKKETIPVRKKTTKSQFMSMNLHSRIIIDQFSFPLEKPQFRSSWWYLFHHVFYCIHKVYLSRKFLGINLDEAINCFMAENVTIVIRGTLIYTKLDHIV